MNFNSRKELDYYLKRYLNIGFGSQGECYYRQKENDVLKIFYDDNDDDDDEYFTKPKTKEEILRFSNVKNKTFIWPTNIITVNNEIVGYITPYIKAKNLYKLNPLNINLNNLEKAITKVHKDIKIISKNSIQTYDMMYNTLYNKDFYIIDQDDYGYSNLNNLKIEKINKERFNYEIYYFLIDNFFNEIVNDNKELKEIYKHKKEDVLIFMKLLRKRLSELVGKEITTLKDANEYRDKYNEENLKYERLLLKI